MQGAAGSADRAHAGRKTGHRGGVLVGDDARRGRGAVEAATGHRKDTHPFRLAQAAPGAGRSKGGIMNPCAQAELVCAYALHALPTRDVPAIEAHVASCAQCRQELEALRPVVESFSSWPTDVLRPAPALQARLARRIAQEAGGEPILPARQYVEPEWEA